MSLAHAAGSPAAPARRGGRVVEGARLERVYTGNRIEGSNPSLSATIRLQTSNSPIWAPKFLLISKGVSTFDRASDTESNPIFVLCMAFVSNHANLGRFGSV